MEPKLPTIRSLSASELPRSGRLVLSGEGFGAARRSSHVLVDGERAIVTRWSRKEVHAYVPETASIGPVRVRVETPRGTSNVLSLRVEPRVPSGHTRWRFTGDSRAVRHRPGIGPDGTVYFQDTNGILYAVAPDGALRWVVDTGDVGSEGPVVVGSDGAIFATSNPLGLALEVWALEPDGSVRWIHHEPNAGQGTIAGPGVGPDGNVYLVTDFGGPGAMSLDANTGAVRWSNGGDPPMNEFGQLGTEIVFLEDRFFVAFDEVAMSPIALLYGFDLEGDQLFSVGQPNNNAQPVVGPAGNVYLQTWNSRIGIRLGAYSASGQAEWTAFTSPTNVLSAPDVGVDGSIYVVRNLRELWSIAPDGIGNWMIQHPDVLYAPVASPDGRTILSAGAVIGSHGFVSAFDATNGNELWSERIEPEPDGTFVAASTRPLFSPTGLTAYVASEPLSNPDDDLHFYLHALDLPSNRSVR